MRTLFVSLFLGILFQCNVPGQKKPPAFEKVNFEKARIGGEEASKFFTRNIKYPYNPAFDGYIDGNVFVSFVIDKTGRIDSIRVLNNPRESFERVVLNALNKSSGLWTPTSFDGITLYKKYVAAFNFTASNLYQFKKDKSQKYFRRGNMTKALRFINEVIMIDPYDISAYQVRAMIYKKQKKNELEIIDLAKVVEINNILLFDLWFLFVR